ncbi:Protein ASPARTIC PROTEASE IN GUARD CELL 1 [Platanthera guangdongensis]|uniref:Protein ASPARTIC PROTEASE IN GUARD CELL 1 n=1 Tax=Platanthera guangdongensis TaxID=2320717 RepID=A0ABR2M0Q9_9ASPA
MPFEETAISTAVLDVFSSVKRSSAAIAFDPQTDHALEQNKVESIPSGNSSTLSIKLNSRDFLLLAIADTHEDYKSLILNRLRRNSTRAKSIFAGVSLAVNGVNKTFVEVSTVALRIDGGKELKLPATNYLILVDSSGAFCLAFAPTSSPLSIIGNVQQQTKRTKKAGIVGKYEAVGWEAGTRIAAPRGRPHSATSAACLAATWRSGGQPGGRPHTSRPLTGDRMAWRRLAGRSNALLVATHGWPYGVEVGRSPCGRMRVAAWRVGSRPHASRPPGAAEAGCGALPLRARRA